MPDIQVQERIKTDLNLKFIYTYIKKARGVLSKSQFYQYYSQYCNKHQ